MTNVITASIMKRLIPQSLFVIALGLAACNSSIPEPTPTLIPTPIPAIPTATPEPEHENGRIYYGAIYQGRMAIRSTNPDGSIVKQLAVYPANAISYITQPDSEMMAWTSLEEDVWMLYVTSFDNVHSEKIKIDLEGLNYVFVDQFSPDAEMIIMTVSRCDGCAEIVVVDLESHNIESLSAMDGSNHDARWSNDGSQIAYISNVDGKPELFVMRSDGTRPVQITNEDGLVSHPVWIDKDYLAYTSTANGVAEIRVTDLSGRNLQATPLTLTEISYGPFVWSPDGEMIAILFGELSGPLLSVKPGSGEEGVILQDAFTVFAWTDQPLNLSDQPGFGVPEILSETDSEDADLVPADLSLVQPLPLVLRFDFHNMQDDVPWRQVWTHESGMQVVIGGFWNEGGNGVYTTLTDLPDHGEWTLELFIEDQLVQRSALTIKR